MLASYSLTFLLLAAEMVTFCAVVAPLPHAVRKRVFTFLSESPVVGKIAYGLKIAFMCVLCFNHVRAFVSLKLIDSPETASWRFCSSTRCSACYVSLLRRKLRRLARLEPRTTCVQRRISLRANSSESSMLMHRWDQTNHRTVRNVIRTSPDSRCSSPYASHGRSTSFWTSFMRRRST